MRRNAALQHWRFCCAAEKTMLVADNSKPIRSLFMAYTSIAKPEFRLSTAIARPFVALFDILIAMAEAHPKMQEVSALNAQTDAQLAARGTDREAEVRRIFAGHFGL
jgi:hypothetical protein